MSEICKTKEEAEIAVEKLGNTVLDIFCPLNSGECSPRCPCYQFPYIQEQSGTYYVHKACCNNAMFHNTCQAGNY
jgi:hypothetical protein